MATQKEQELAQLKADLEVRRANSDRERENLESMLAKKSEEVSFFLSLLSLSLSLSLSLQHAYIYI
jgi:hypothetical protein